MWEIEEVDAGSVRHRLAWFKMYLRYAVKSLFGPPMRYQVVIRVNSSGSSDDVIMALDACKDAYIATGAKYEPL
jgi:hypothetical protein